MNSCAQYTEIIEVYILSPSLTENYVKSTYLLSYITNWFHEPFLFWWEPLKWQSIFAFFVLQNTQLFFVKSIQSQVNFTKTLFGEYFVKALHLLNKSLKSWFDRKKFWWQQIFNFSTVCTALWSLRKFCISVFFEQFPWKQHI